MHTEQSICTVSGHWAVGSGIQQSAALAHAPMKSTMRRPVGRWKKVSP
jgi:hypothetical protein